MLSSPTTSQTEQERTIGVLLLCRRGLCRCKEGETLRSDHGTHRSHRKLAFQQVAAESERAVACLLLEEGAPALQIERFWIRARKEGSVKEPSSLAERICVVKRSAVTLAPIGRGEGRQETRIMCLQLFLLRFAKTRQQRRRTYLTRTQRTYKHFAARESRKRRRSGEVAGERRAPAWCRRGMGRARARNASPGKRQPRPDTEGEAEAA